MWANQPSTDSYTPNAAYQYNSTGGTNTVTRTGVGAYTVSLPGANAGSGNTQVTASSGSDETTAFDFGQYCEIANEPKGTNFFVTCFGIGGSPPDVGFTLLYTSGDVFLGWNSAYVYGYEKSTESYTPTCGYQFNIHNLENTIVRVGTGQYDVTLPGINAGEGNVQVTAVGEPPTTCSAAMWQPDADGTGKTVTVLCSDATGAPVDSEFMLLNVSSVTAESAEGAYEVWPRGAYAWINHGEKSARYVPGKNFQFNAGGADIEAEWLGTGSYAVYLPGVGSETGTFQVTAFGSETPAVMCQLYCWELADTDLTAFVTCFDASGAPADSRFTIQYVSLEP